MSIHNLAVFYFDPTVSTVQMQSSIVLLVHIFLVTHSFIIHRALSYTHTCALTYLCNDTQLLCEEREAKKKRSDELIWEE